MTTNRTPSPRNEDTVTTWMMAVILVCILALGYFNIFIVNQ